MLHRDGSRRSCSGSTTGRPSSATSRSGAGSARTIRPSCSKPARCTCAAAARPSGRARRSSTPREVARRAQPGARGPRARGPVRHLDARGRPERGVPGRSAARPTREALQLRADAGAARPARACASTACSTRSGDDGAHQEPGSAGRGGRGRPRRDRSGRWPRARPPGRHSSCSREAHIAGDRPAEAINVLQRVAARGARRAAYPKGTAGEPAACAHRRDPRAHGHAALPARTSAGRRRLLTRAIDENDPALLDRILLEYPNASVVTDALLERARRASPAAGRSWRRATCGACCARAPEDHPLVPTALAALAVAYRDAGALGAARAALDRLAERHAARDLLVGRQDLDGRDLREPPSASAASSARPPSAGPAAAGAADAAVRGPLRGRRRRGVRAPHRRRDRHRRSRAAAAPPRSR